MTASQIINIIVAATKENGIGKNGDLPFRIRRDMNYFAALTTHLKQGDSVYPLKKLDSEKEKMSNSSLNCCIMGRKTWESIPKKFRPLKDRINVVLSRSFTGISGTVNEDGAFYFTSLESALEWSKSNSFPTIWIIGGAQIYNIAKQHCENIFLTRVYSKKSNQDDTAVIDCDTHLPLVDTDNLSLNYERLCDDQIKSLIGPEAPIGQQSEGDFTFEFQIWKRRSLPRLD